VEKILTIIDKMNQFIGDIVSLLIIPIFLIMLYEVFIRYVLNSPGVWSTELAQLLFGAYAVLSAGIILQWGGHVNVDIFYGRFSKRGKAVLDICTSFLFFIFSITLVYTSYKFAFHSIKIVEHMETTWNPPIYPFKTMIAIAAVLLLLQGIAKLIRDIEIVFSAKKNKGLD